ncbi:hypothetical protein V5O48_017602 [Marasmius crinis-equi]|uniref:Uncharacterized protein n=1 Tax=Marasmius crinis-equi TaxID=585013 RepID=A0ABR3ENJ5_9AGAR
MPVFLDPTLSQSTQFGSFQRKFKGTAGKGKTVSKAGGPEVEGGDIALNPNTFQNRAIGKLKVCLQKRKSKSVSDALKWVKEEKYNAAFEVNHMSDDEDYQENDQKVKNKYLARPPAFRSVQAATFAKRGRHWMYKEDWLQENLSFNTKIYMLDNGKLWGDPTDPVEQEDLKKEVKQVKKERKRKSEEGTGGDGDEKKKKKKKKKKRKEKT